MRSVMAPSKKWRTRRYYRDEGQQIAQGHQRRPLVSIGPIFLIRRVPQSNFVLIVEPCLIVRSNRNIFNPLNKTLFNGCFVLVVRFSVRSQKPLRQMRLGSDDGAPRIHHLFGLRREKRSVFALQLCVVSCPSESLLQLEEFFSRDR